MSELADVGWSGPATLQITDLESGICSEVDFETSGPRLLLDRAVAVASPLLLSLEGRVG